MRRTPALGCARCPCRPFHRACAPQSGPGAQTCPQCAQPSVVPFTGALTQRALAASGEGVALAEARDARACVLEVTRGVALVTGRSQNE